MNVFLLAWLASVMYAVETILGKIVSRHSIANPWLFNFLWNFFILIGTTIFAIWFGIGLPTSWIFVVLASLAYAIAGTCYILALYLLDVSVLTPLFAFRTALAVLVGVIFLGEILTQAQYILIVIIFISGIFVSIDENFSLRSFFKKKIGIAILSMLALVAMSVFVKKSVAIVGFWNTIFWMGFLGQIWMCTTIPLFKKDFLKTTKKQYGSLVLIAIAGTLGTLAANAAFAENVSIASVIISLPLSMLAAFLISQWHPELLEKHTLKVYAARFIAATIMVIAALKL